MDYLSLPVSLSQEVREILDRVRPSTVSPDTISQQLLVFLARSFMFFTVEMPHGTLGLFVFQLGSALRLQGMTPAAVVNLLNYVHHRGQKEGGRRNKLGPKDQGEEEVVRNAPLTQ